MIAVVGSLGKTTTSVAVGTALGVPVLWRVPNTRFRLAPTLLRIHPWQRYSVIEVGNPSRMHRNAQIVRPDVVVVTSIASEHNRGLGSLDHIRDKKAQILHGLRRGGLVVLNGDDHRVQAMANLTDERVLTFGFGAGNNIRARELSLDWPHGTRLEVDVGGAPLKLRVLLLGRVMAYPILAAITVAWAEGLPLDEVVRVLEAMAPPPGRLQLVELPDGVWMIRDEFKSTLETIDAALDLLAEVPGRRIAVLGEISEPPGSQGPHYRRLGERLGAIVSRAVIVASKKSFRSYAVGATGAGLPRAALVHVLGVDEAVEAVRADLRPGDVVLVKGRDTQRLDRVALALQGRAIGCRIDFCRLTTTRCEGCPMLELGWQGEGWGVMQEVRTLLKALD
jgi:UDP-N-acetylmuramoyl-tripeptide--D-alanyl-D-alanine ligase